MEENSLHSDASSVDEIEIKSKRYEYNGYEPTLNDKIDVIDSDILPETFYNNYIVKRKPVIIKKLLVDKDFNTTNWSLSYLKEKAGNCQVLVEDRSKSTRSNSFGVNAPKVLMKYADFIDEISIGNENLYLTTQDLESDKVDKFGMCTAVMADPLTCLDKDFAQKPKHLSCLVPHLISLWQGCSHHGISSGLHHDFHDNLYLVIRGSKKFHLLPPSNHSLLKMPTKPVRIYPNGLIVYSRNKHYPDLIPVRSDGVPYEFLSQVIRDMAKSSMLKCRADLKRLIKENASSEKIQSIRNEKLEFEMQVEAAEDEMLQYNGNDADDDDGGSNHISIQDSDDEPIEKKEKSTDCDSALIPLHYDHG